MQEQSPFALAYGRMQRAAVLVQATTERPLRRSIDQSHHRLTDIKTQVEVTTSHLTAQLCCVP